MKTLDELIVKLLELQAQGKGKYEAKDLNYDWSIDFEVVDDLKIIYFG